MEAYMQQIRLAQREDLDGWMALVESVKDSFPGLETPEALAEHRNTAAMFIDRAEAICAKADGRVVGALLFSRENSTLCFLAVDREFRRQHIAERMVSHMLERMEPGRDITVTTYREDDPRGAAARAFYQKMGFIAGMLTEEFGSPVQEFVLKQ